MITLTQHFTLQEFIYSNTARILGINNAPTPIIIGNLRRLARFDELVRLELGGVGMTISSGYRCPALNRAVGGAHNSSHLTGLANDFIAPAFGTPMAICRKLDQSYLQFDQLIYERTGSAVWVHLSIAAEDTKPRRQVLTIDRQGTRVGLWS
ncbi:D-Ala-D-Ala carboxypeptidase family metallohydrolase [Glaciimonas sp. PAMC28666]|uniref:D-Ala-D-Ala carboxypeptidase family metallohydrolase n=1 Tax=Glaciimonas sp. PAMC28666 TaxID=2807626 RepID=UPI001962FE7C|nr:D-Ala-D-Ala carboxypeptidase family metallohydrolase [Glaciimonas sp. PAMC28666]QRX82312.1 peptidase M15 [Glaciimonas sp. PAMC28666]